MIGKLSGNSYKWISEKKKTPKNLHYLGPKHVEIVNAALAQSLFLVTTSTSDEGFSNNIIQAWLQKNSVVAFEFDPAGMIKEHQAGFVANNGFEDFAEKTKNLIDNKLLREELGVNAFDFANQHFSTKKTVDKLESLFKDIMRSS
ncbi:glycosyltransferase [Rhodohalobacter sulfatireducens]|uniref:Glycosyltransferase n=1 Tax=Rhodohalobacter sulfatireducens TaxID=2911366 RepID=A0ABS9KIK6_9BACT|nr:glycosyltransferase [Rhodohalobacter sulfatireducens]MCG2590669.1 glycosyltransferase [Rhodohalobacter sulfatireducens]